MLGARLAPLGISFEDDFGIAIGEKLIALGMQFHAELGVVVDGAVEDEG